MDKESRNSKKTDTAADRRKVKQPRELPAYARDAIRMKEGYYVPKEYILPENFALPEGVVIPQDFHLYIPYDLRHGEVFIRYYIVYMPCLVAERFGLTEMKNVVLSFNPFKNVICMDFYKEDSLAEKIATHLDFNDGKSQRIKQYLFRFSIKELALYYNIKITSAYYYRFDAIARNKFLLDMKATTRRRFTSDVTNNRSLKKAIVVKYRDYMNQKIEEGDVGPEELANFQPEEKRGKIKKKAKPKKPPVLQGVLVETAEQPAEAQIVNTPATNTETPTETNSTENPENS